MPRFCIIIVALVLAVVSTGMLWFTFDHFVPLHSRSVSLEHRVFSENSLLSRVEMIVEASELNPVRIQDFAKMGHRMRFLKDWINIAQDLKHLGASAELTGQLWESSERLASTLMPFLRHPSLPRPLHTAISSHNSGTQGIVIPAGNGNFHFACHLIANIREILNSTLPIEVAFGGDGDLSIQRRKFVTNTWPDVKLLDVTSRVNDDTVDLYLGRYAIKPFAALASRFEKVILLDADDIFLQDPERLFESPGFEATGTMLFHDRAIWATRDRFHEEWWQDQFDTLGDISDNIAKSRAMLERFSEHGESGVVVLDKSRTSVVLGLLHTCWQNTRDVRRSVTYDVGNGDKESWWFGFEALGTPYAMDEKYAIALGSPCPQHAGEVRVCTTNIGHLDHEDRLLWWNGGLFQDKSAAELVYSDLPSVWMVDGQWTPAERGYYSSMIHSHYEYVTAEEAHIISRIIRRAQAIDQLLGEHLRYL